MKSYARVQLLSAHHGPAWHIGYSVSYLHRYEVEVDVLHRNPDDQAVLDGLGVVGFEIARQAGSKRSIFNARWCTRELRLEFA